MSIYTTGNLITSFTAPNELFDALYQDLTSTKKAIELAWMTSLVSLKPAIDLTGMKTDLDKVHAGVVQRGGSV